MTSNTSYEIRPTSQPLQLSFSYCPHLLLFSDHPTIESIATVKSITLFLELFYYRSTVQRIVRSVQRTSSSVATH